MRNWYDNVTDNTIKIMKQNERSHRIEYENITFGMEAEDKIAKETNGWPGGKYRITVEEI